MHTPCHRRGHEGLSLGSDWGSLFTAAPVAPQSRFLCWGHSVGFRASTAQSQQASGSEPSAKPSPYGLRVSGVKWADRSPSQLCLY